MVGSTSLRLVFGCGAEVNLRFASVPERWVYRMQPGDNSRFVNLGRRLHKLRADHGRVAAQPNQG